MYGRLFSHSLTRFVRSASLERRAVERIFLLLGAGYIALMLAVIGFVLPKIASDLASEDPAALIHSYTLHAMLVLLVFRLLSQKMPSAEIRPYLTLPIPRRALLRVAHVDAALSYFSIFPLFFLVPFGLVMWQNGMVEAPLIWFGSLMLLVAATHFLHLTLRLQIQDLTTTGKVAIGGALVLIAADAWLGTRVLPFLSEAWFGGLAAGQVTPALVCGAIVAVSAVLSNRELRRRIDVIAADESGSTTQRSGDAALAGGVRSLLDRLPDALVPGHTRSLMMVEAHMFIRAKRARQVALVGVGLGVYFIGFMMISPNILQGGGGTFVLFTMLAILGPAFNYGQYGVSFSGTFLDRVLSIPAEADFMRAKLRMVQAFCVIGLLLFGPAMAYLLPNGPLLTLASFLLAAGFFGPLVLAVSTLAREAIRLNESQFANFQGANARLIAGGFGIILLLLPFGLVPKGSMEIAMAVVGTLGLAADALWLRLLSSLFHRQRPAIAAGCRTSAE